MQLEHQACKAFCEMPGINDMFEPFNEEFMKINSESLKGMAEQEPELTEYFKQPDEYFMVRLHMPYFLPSSNHATFLYGFYLICFIYHFGCINYVNIQMRT
ncbi:hypothetical protein SLEP1_g53048 [Rubroshorea leprosula]|uniref:Uncharacterized protein n=1 Tax=Rubroshorea leprosula TaxID=152421 RepID=A0AAV5MC20_9ROSI|nr:hypothetical protein SLEP1_g53048 [Rubroshorea leprosula]